MHLLGLLIGFINKKYGVELITKNEAIFGLANSINNEIIISLSLIKSKVRFTSILNIVLKYTNRTGIISKKIR